MTNTHNSLFDHPIEVKMTWFDSKDWEFYSGSYLSTYRLVSRLVNRFPNILRVVVYNRGEITRVNRLPLTIDSYEQFCRGLQNDEIILSCSDVDKYIEILESTTQGIKHIRAWWCGHAHVNRTHNRA